MTTQLIFILVTGGLTFQGHATADNQVSELVLGGTVADDDWRTLLVRRP